MEPAATQAATANSSANSPTRPPVVLIGGPKSRTSTAIPRADHPRQRSQRVVASVGGMFALGEGRRRRQRHVVPDRSILATRPLAAARGRRQSRSLQCLAIAVMSGNDLERRLNEALREVERLRAENERLRMLLTLAQQTTTILESSRPEAPPKSANSPASTDEKLALVRRLFRGRDDVYALRWESARTGKNGYAPAVAEGWSRQGSKTYLPLDDHAVERHL